MSEMVERIARRLYEAADNTDGANPAWPDLEDDYRDAYRHDAREVLEVMREPTPIMLAARPAGMSGACWAAMIEAELATC